MVARTLPSPIGGMTVVFTRAGKVEAHFHAASGKEAAGHAIELILALATLEPGDTLTVEPDGEGKDELPEVSRSAHYS